MILTYRSRLLPLKSRHVAITVGALFALLKAILVLPSRLLGPSRLIGTIGE